MLEGQQEKRRKGTGEEQEKPGLVMFSQLGAAQETPMAKQSPADLPRHSGFAVLSGVVTLRTQSSV